jgi:transcription elongation factor Elf1
MVTKSCKKVAKKFTCLKCNYNTSRKSSWNKHVLTAKHVNGNKMVTNGNEVDDFICNTCGKMYKFNSGLSRHRKKCFPSTTNVVAESCKKLQHAQMIKTMEKLIDQNTELSKRVGNNNNNKISINVFLNEKCKGAMNLTDFVDNIKVSIDDLQYTKEHGYVKGISNIFVKHLTDMNITDRPIHCSDKKRLQFYIKDENEWSKDKTHNKLHETIKHISQQQIKQIKCWEEQHPNYINNNVLLNEWHKMIYNMMGGSTQEDIMNNTENIKKCLSDNTYVKEIIIN